MHLRDFNYLPTIFTWDINSISTIKRDWIVFPVLIWLLGGQSGCLLGWMHVHLLGPSHHQQDKRRLSCRADKTLCGDHWITGCPCYRRMCQGYHRALLCRWGPTLYYISKMHMEKGCITYTASLIIVSVGPTVVENVDDPGWFQLLDHTIQYCSCILGLWWKLSDNTKPIKLHITLHIWLFVNDQF